MVYPWSNKNDEETSNVEEVDDKQNSEENIVEDSGANEPTGEETTDNEVWDSEDPRAIMLNILKLEGYKMDSGELFIAFKGASKNSEEESVMADFSSALEQLSELGKIRSDSDGNIMTVEDYDREKSQSTTNEDTEEQNSVDKESSEEKKENSAEENVDKDTSKEEDTEESDGEDLESIIKLKEETDSWLIEKLKNNNSSEDSEDLRKEVKELRARVEKLEKIIVNLTNAFT